MAYGEPITTYARGFRVTITEQGVPVKDAQPKLYGILATLTTHPHRAGGSITISKRRDEFAEGKPWEEALVNFAALGSISGSAATLYAEAILAAVEVARELNAKYHD